MRNIMKKFKECLKWLASISVVGAGFGFIVSAIFFPKVEPLLKFQYLRSEGQGESTCRRVPHPHNITSCGTEFMTPVVGYHGAR
jgi:hypothetical protein